jgi:alkylation response protein AidB-like acyl-CoA dehydrogenase
MSEARDRAETLRAAVRRFRRETVPPDLMRKACRHQALEKEDYVRWMRLLHAQGWATAPWPKEYGGLDWSPIERFVLEDELARQECPWIIPFGVKYVAPVIYSFGSEAQKARFLPRIANTEEWWAQGYSEPGAGSDLAGLRTHAELDGDHYVVTGQKIWTTYAHWADWLFCLVRTDRTVRPQAGITFLLIDMKSPGITVKPIRTMDGYHHVNEVWLEGVRVPVENRVGEAGKGWGYAKFLLQNERTTGYLIGTVFAVLERLKRFAAESKSTDPLLSHRIGEFDLRFLALEEVAYQAIEAMMNGTENGGEASLIKIRGPELYQHVAEALIEAMGMAGIAFDPASLAGPVPPPFGPDDTSGLLKEHFYNRTSTIAGGSSEIQRNIIAKAVLGL